MTCDFCNVCQMSGNKVSHSNIKTRKKQKANVQRLHALINGRPKTVYACTSCIKSGRIVKSA